MQYSINTLNEKDVQDSRQELCSYCLLLYPTLKQWVVNKMGNSNSCQPLHVRNTATCSSHSVIVHYLCLMQTLVTVTIHFRKIITIWKILWELKFPISLKCDQNYNKNKTPSRRKPTPSRASKQRKHTSF